MSALDERTHRVVARLRADEVTFLEKDSRGCNMPLYSISEKRACPHLKLFHNKGTTVDGGPWWACWICAVSDEPERAYHAERREEHDKLERATRRQDMFAIFVLGLIVGVVGLFLFAWWRAT